MINSHALEPDYNQLVLRNFPPIKLDYIVFPKSIALGIIEKVFFMGYRVLYKSWY